MNLQTAEAHPIAGLCGENLDRLVDYAEELIASPAWQERFLRLSPQAQADVTAMLVQYRTLCGQKSKLRAAYWQVGRARNLNSSWWTPDRFADSDINIARDFLVSIVPRANKRLSRELGLLVRQHAVMYRDRIMVVKPKIPASRSV